MLLHNRPEPPKSDDSHGADRLDAGPPPESVQAEGVQAEDVPPEDAQPEDAQPEDGAGILASAPPITEIDEVASALEHSGYNVCRCNLDDDIDRLGFAVVVERPDLIINLVDQMWDDATQHAGVAQLCDLYGYPYAGSDPLTLATCQERTRVRLILDDAGVQGPGFAIVRDINSIPNTDELTAPLIVTQAFDDIYEIEGIAHPVTSREELEERVAELAAEYELPLLVEEFISGPRLQAIVIGNRSLQVLPLTETHLDEEGRVEDIGIAQLEQEQAQHARELARTAFRAMACRDVAQIDLCLADDGDVYVIDVRPAFDMGAGSPFHVAASTVEDGYDSAVARVIATSLERAGVRSSAPEATVEPVTTTLSEPAAATES